MLIPSIVDKKSKSGADTIFRMCLNIADGIGVALMRLSGDGPGGDAIKATILEHFCQAAGLNIAVIDYGIWRKTPRT
ncbi:MAG: hypothetical protein AB9879_15860 [Methanothrix sp.]